jgi:hypothetical protein
MPALTLAEALQDQVEFVDGKEVDLGCNCGETWTVWLHEGERLTELQLECPSCDGEGAES